VTEAASQPLPADELPPTKVKLADASWTTPLLIVLGAGAALAGLLAAEFLRKSPRSAGVARSASADATQPAAMPIPRDVRATAATPPAAVVVPALLDRLIGQQFLIETETVGLPKGVRIHGRPVERSDEPEFRLDAAHPMPPPHIRQAAATDAATARHEATPAVQNIPRRGAAEPTRHHRVDPRETRVAEAKLLERVLAELDRGRRAAASRGPHLPGRVTGSSFRVATVRDGGAR
jgi:hypothetical protein